MFSNEEVALKDLEKWCRIQIQETTSMLADGGVSNYEQYCGQVQRIATLGDVIEEVQNMIGRFRNDDTD